MEKINLNIILSYITTLAIYVFGELDIALSALLIAIVLDYTTGVIKGYTKKELSSKTGFKGLAKKVGYLILVAVAVIVDRIAGNTGTIRTLVMYYFVANELLSVLENWGAMGIPFPKVLKEKLEQLKSESE